MFSTLRNSTSLLQISRGRSMKKITIYIFSKYNFIFSSLKFRNTVQKNLNLSPLLPSNGRISPGIDFTRGNTNCSADKPEHKTFDWNEEGESPLLESFIVWSFVFRWIINRVSFDQRRKEKRARNFCFSNRIPPPPYFLGAERLKLFK